MTHSRTKTAPETTTPRKKLSLKKKTVRDLDLRGHARAVKGGQYGPATLSSRGASVSD